MPSKSDKDIVMSIKSEHISRIAQRRKNHEYRKYLLPVTVQYIWFYTTSPEQEIRYVAEVGCGKEPGQVPEDGGIGNADFNAGKKESKYGYKILGLWELREPMSLKYLKDRGYLKGPPQKYGWALEDMVSGCALGNQIRIV